MKWGELTRQAYALRKESKRLYREAEQMLLDALKVNGQDLSHETSYEMRFFDAWSTERIDAEYFHPEKRNILEQLEQMPGKSVGVYFDSIRDLLVPNRKMTDTVFNYDLTHALRYFLDSDIETVSASKLGSTKRRFTNNDVVISRLRSYLREISIVCTPKEFNCVGSTEFFVLRPKSNVTSELLLTYLRSDPVQKILKWCQDGSNHPRFQEKELLALKMPDQIILIQDDITELINQGVNAYKRSRNLLEAAKHKVEEIILNGITDG